MAGTFRTLGDLRERHLGLRRATVAHHARLDEARLARIEAGEPPTVYELERLADVFGMDADVLADEPIRIAAGDVLGVLALQSEFKNIGDTARLRVLQAAAAARDVLVLQRLLEPERIDPRAGLQAQLPRQIQRRKLTERPFETGKRLAAEFRKHFGLGTGPIASMRDLAGQLAPNLTLLYGNLASAELAGVTFVDAVHGPTVVLNLGGKNENVGVRRFSLAHELCHLLVDWNRQEPIGVLSGFLDPRKLEREQRANAFAAYLLCPQNRVEALMGRLPPREVARTMMREWGLHYGACQLYLKNLANVDLPLQPPSDLDVAGELSPWIEAEKPLGMDGFPLAAVPDVRRTHVARLGAMAWSAGLLQRDRFAALLAVPVDAEVERVVDYFALDRPESPA